VIDPFIPGRRIKIATGIGRGGRGPFGVTHQNREETSMSFERDRRDFARLLGLGGFSSVVSE
jgi:hypothetical protein